jgi:hypothetical protein
MLSRPSSASSSAKRIEVTVNKENGCAAVVRISRRVDFFKHGLTEIADGIP